MRVNGFLVAGASALAIVSALASGAAAAYGGKGAAQSGGFVVRLGADTVSVERWTRTGNKLVVDQVGRAPRVRGPLSSRLPSPAPRLPTRPRCIDRRTGVCMAAAAQSFQAIGFT